MDTSSEDPDGLGGRTAPTAVPLAYRLCPRCARAVPTSSPERYCANDGTHLLDACPKCQAPITSPYAHFCVCCGHDLTRLS